MAVNTDWGTISDCSSQISPNNIWKLIWKLERNFQGIWHSRVLLLWPFKMITNQKRQKKEKGGRLLIYLFKLTVGEYCNKNMPGKKSQRWGLVEEKLETHQLTSSLLRGVCCHQWWLAQASCISVSCYWQLTADSESSESPCGSNNKAKAWQQRKEDTRISICCYRGHQTCHSSDLCVWGLYSKSRYTNHPPLEASVASSTLNRSH